MQFGRRCNIGWVTSDKPQKNNDLQILQVYYYFQNSYLVISFVYASRDLLVSTLLHGWPPPWKSEMPIKDTFLALTYDQTRKIWSGEIDVCLCNWHHLPTKFCNIKLLFQTKVNYFLFPFRQRKIYKVVICCITCCCK